MEERELVCIGCPLGCMMTVTLNGQEVSKISGNTCKRGEIYGKKEMTNPTRIVTSTVLVNGGAVKTVSVKTKDDIPKKDVMACMKALKGKTVDAPVFIGDVILANVAGTGVAVVATKHVPAL